ncbi:hypothetical protein FHT82_006111 [Rhizobium sp. BK275]|nr:hypothetical protein [Rhizobium sp. BK275]
MLLAVAAACWSRFRDRALLSCMLSMSVSRSAERQG